MAMLTDRELSPCSRCCAVLPAYRELVLIHKCDAYAATVTDVDHAAAVDHAIAVTMLAFVNQLEICSGLDLTFHWNN